MRVSLLPEMVSASRLLRSRKMKLLSRRSLFSASDKLRRRRRPRNAFIDTRLMLDQARLSDVRVLRPSKARLPTRLKLLPWRSNSLTCADKSFVVREWLLVECKLRRGDWNCRTGKCRTGKWRTNLQGWKMQDWKLTDKNYRGWKMTETVLKDSWRPCTCIMAHVRLN